MMYERIAKGLGGDNGPGVQRCRDGREAEPPG